MLDNPFIDVLIGLFFFFCAFSIVCSAVQEMIASLLHLRGKNLLKGLNQIMGEALSKELYEKSHLNALMANSRYLPSYVDSKAAAASVTRHINDLKQAATGVEDLVSEFEKLANKTGSPILQEIASRLDGSVEEAADKAKQINAKVKEIEAKAEEIFDESMDRISGWYARQAKFMIFVVALLLAGLTNSDTIRLANSLWEDEALRKQLSAQAEAFVALPEEEKQKWCSASEGCFDKLDATFPIGWDLPAASKSDGKSESLGWVLRIFGWLLTAIAASMGAPFWFDLLGRVTRLKGAGNPPQKKAAS